MDWFNSHYVLVHTGKGRPAKNLLTRVRHGVYASIECARVRIREAMLYMHNGLYCMQVLPSVRGMCATCNVVFLSLHLRGPGCVCDWVGKHERLIDT